MSLRRTHNRREFGTEAAGQLRLSQDVRQQLGKITNLESAQARLQAEL